MARSQPSARPSARCLLYCHRAAAAAAAAISAAAATAAAAAASAAAAAAAAAAVAATTPLARPSRFSSAPFAKGGASTLVAHEAELVARHHHVTRCHVAAHVRHGLPR